jgi:mannan endo-1,4-beta-mannosidase
MFWDGTRWIDERAPAAPPPPSRRRTRDWLSTGVMILGIVALAVPFAATSAASSSADRLIASWSGSYETRVFQESTVLARYTGTWNRQKNSQFMGSYAAISTQADAIVDFTFTGSGVSWIGPKGPNQGRARVYLDGQYLRTIDNYSRAPMPRESLFTASFSDVTQHTLTIDVLRSTTRTIVTVDAFEVRGAALSVTSAQRLTPRANSTPGQPAAPAPTPTPTPASIATSTPTPAATPKTTSATAGFIQRRGTALVLNGAPHRLVGINVYTAFWGSRYAYSNDLTTALPVLSGKVNVARVWGVQASAITDGVRDWTDWDAGLALFAKYGIKVIVVLTDQWHGYPVTDSATNRSIDWYRDGYKTTVEGVSTYRDWVIEAVTRYKDNPTIAVWQLVNEGEARNADGTCVRADAANALRAFADDMARLIKSIDPNHLVGLGTIAGECGSNEADYAYIHAGPDIDVMDWHDYGINSDGAPDPGHPLGVDNAECGFTVSRARAVANGKVFIVGEAGINWSAFGITRAERAALFDAKLAAQFAAGSQGELLFHWHDAPMTDHPTRGLEITTDDPALAMLARY